MQKRNQIYPQKSWIKVLSVLVMISSLLGGCQLPWQTSPEEKNQDSVSLATPYVPAETPQPRQDLPPALVEVTPVPDSVVSLQQPISLYFNQPMDTASVEAAVIFETRVSGRLSWEGDQGM